MSDEQLQNTSHLLPSLLCQRRQGDFMANDLLRSFASHLLLSCEQSFEGDDLEDSMMDWRLGMRIRFGTPSERSMILIDQANRQKAGKGRRRLVGS